ncbi:MAG: amidohydrolase [Candidatus Azotimanducaceae bacterium]|jgi:amidohydrolase
MPNAVQLDKLTTFRKLLHAFPEVSGQEFETQKRIIAFLKKETKATLSKVGNTGVLAIFKGKSKGPRVMLRCDIDALPISEINTFAHRSTIQGVSHKCGHDGHTSILLGLSIILSEQPIASGEVLLLFQPAEENGRGAQAVLNSTNFKNLDLDYAFALHNLPGFPNHEIVVKNNAFTANVKSIVLKMEGKTAHAAEPQNGINPSLAISEMFEFANRMSLNNPEDKNFFLITPVYNKLGSEKAFGVSAGSAEMHFTIRSWSAELMENKRAAIIRFTDEICKKHQLTYSLTWTEEFYANMNNSEAVDLIRKASNQLQLHTTEKESPFTWGEDFGLFTQKYKGAMFGLGSGTNTPALHNPDYDYPDHITVTGIQMFHSIIQQIL